MLFVSQGKKEKKNLFLFILYFVEFLFILNKWLNEFTRAIREKKKKSIHEFVNTMIIDKYRYRNGCLTSILRMSKNMQPLLLRFSID